MKKLIGLVMATVLLVGCGELTPEQKIHNVATDADVQVEIQALQQQLDRGEITEKYDRERFEQILRQRKEENSDDPEAILKRIEKISPESATLLRAKLAEQEAATTE